MCTLDRQCVTLCIARRRTSPFAIFMVISHAVVYRRAWEPWVSQADVRVRHSAVRIAWWAIHCRFDTHSVDKKLRCLLPLYIDFYYKSVFISLDTGVIQRVLTVFFNGFSGYLSEINVNYSKTLCNTSNICWRRITTALGNKHGCLAWAVIRDTCRVSWFTQDVQPRYGTGPWARGQQSGIGYYYSTSSPCNLNGDHQRGSVHDLTPPWVFAYAPLCDCCVDTPSHLEQRKGHTARLLCPLDIVRIYITMMNFLVSHFLIVSLHVLWFYIGLLYDDDESCFRPSDMIVTILYFCSLIL